LCYDSNGLSINERNDFDGNLERSRLAQAGQEKAGRRHTLRSIDAAATGAERD